MIPSKAVVLIVTSAVDAHADAVIRRLEGDHLLRPVRINSDDFTTNTSYSFVWDQHAAVTSAALAVHDSGLQTSSAAVGWWRKPGAARSAPRLATQDADDFATRETDTLLRCLDVAFSPMSWLNHPSAMAAAGRKLTQFPVASGHGLAIPETIISNEPRELIAFIQATGQCVVKPMESQSFFSQSGRQFVQYTHRINARDVEEFASNVAFAPVMVQREIEKRREFRVTVIGDELFACEIVPPPGGHAVPDWRHSSVMDLTYRIVDLPSSISDALFAILSHFGLRYGAFDIAEDSDGRYVFFELNPNGQYYWIELKTGAPLTAAVVMLLRKLASQGE